MDFEAQCQDIEENFKQLEIALTDQELLSDQDRYRETAKKHAELGRILEQWHKYSELQDSLEQAQGLLHDDDSDMVEMAREEVESTEKEIESTEKKLMHLLLPKDPMDEKNIVMEVRAGTGGEEAALFAGDLVRAYTRYFEMKGWKIEFLSSNPTELGGFKEVIFSVSGDSVYSHMKFESGTHRVQRVPSTETQGRIHTSAITVAVLPEASEVDVQIKNEDIRIDVFRSSGPGGQSVNTTDSAVRITHLPTELIVSCQDEKSQHKNRAKALKVLRSRLLELEIRKQQEAESAERREQVGTGDRSGRIRTYNFPQNRLSDHRIGLTLHQLGSVMEGNFDPVVEALQADEMQKRLQAAGQI